MISYLGKKVKDEEKMRKHLNFQWKIFILMFGIWFFDFLTTLFALNFMGLAELNPIANSLYELGWYGYCIMLGITAGLCFLFSWGISKSYYQLSSVFGKKRAFFFIFLPISAFCSLEVFAIINNLSWIFA